MSDESTELPDPNDPSWPIPMPERALWIEGVRSFKMSFAILVREKPTQYRKTVAKSKSWVGSGTIVFDAAASTPGIQTEFVGKVVVKKAYRYKEVWNHDDGTDTTVIEGEETETWDVYVGFDLGVLGRYRMWHWDGPNSACVPVTSRRWETGRNEPDEFSYQEGFFWWDGFDSNADTRPPLLEGDLPREAGALSGSNTAPLDIHLAEGTYAGRWSLDPVGMAVIDVPPASEDPPPVDPPSTDPVPPAPPSQKPHPLPKRPPKPPVSNSGNPKHARGRRPRPPTGSRRELAQRIVDNPRIDLAQGHVSGVKDKTYPSAQLAAVARGEPAKRSDYQGAPGGTVPLDPGMLQGIEDLGGKFAFGISEIAGGSHGAGSYHYYGRAFDVNTINGLPVSAANPHYRRFMQEAARLGARGMLGPGDPGHAGHIHITWPQTPASQIIADPKPPGRANEAHSERAGEEPDERSPPTEPVPTPSETRRKLNDLVLHRLAEVVELEGVVKLNGRKVDEVEALIGILATGVLRTVNEAARRAVFQSRWNKEANGLPNQTARLEIRPRLNVLPEIDHVEVDHF